MQSADVHNSTNSNTVLSTVATASLSAGAEKGGSRQKEGGFVAAALAFQLMSTQCCILILPLVGLWTLVVAIFSGHIEDMHEDNEQSSSNSNASVDVRVTSSSVWILCLFAASASSHSIYNLSSFMFLSRVSPLTHAIGNVFKRVFTMLSAVVWTAIVVSTTSPTDTHSYPVSVGSLHMIIGFIIACFGLFYYATIK